MGDAAGKDDDRDDDLVMVGDGVETDEEAAARRAAADADDERRRDEDDDGDDDEGGGEQRHADDDARAGHGEPDDDDKQARRREERRERKQRQREARERDQRELKFLRKRNEEVEQRISDLAKRVDANESSTIDGRISQIDAAIRNAEDVYAKAISAQNGEDAAEAQRIRDGLRDRRAQLVQYKETRGSRGADGDGGRDAGPDPALLAKVRDWHGRNSWFRFDRGDEDSAIVGAIDDNLVREGYDPTTSEYYEELDRRIARRLPHRVSGGGVRRSADDDDGDDGAGAGNGKGGKGGKGGEKPRGPRFRIGGRERQLKPNEVHISRERKEAMIEAGVWDDPVLRKRYLKQYAKYDRDHSEDTR